MRKIIPFILILVACGKSSQIQNETTKNIQLSLNDIFNKEKVIEYASLEESKNLQEKAKKEFLLGVDQYRNRKVIDSAIQTFSSSITTYPFAKSYYELGNAYMDANNLEKSLEAYKMAEVLQFAPISKVLYNISCVYSKMNGEGDIDKSLEYLKNAIENGYTNLDHIMKDEDLKNARDNYQFTEIVSTSMNASTTGNAALYQMFLNHFEQAKFPLNLNFANSQKVNYEKSISYDFENFIPGMRNNEFSRDAGSEYTFAYKLYATKNYTAVIYTESVMYYDNPPVIMMLATYNNKTGKMISSTKVAGYIYEGENIFESTFSSDMKFTVSESKPEYEKDVDKYGYDNNKIIRQELVEKVAYTISVDGEINADEKFN